MTEEIIDSSNLNLARGWKELWRFRELFYFFTWRDIKIKYKQTVLGFLWAILQPLVMMLIFSFFFGRSLNIQSGNLPYPVYVISGIILWNLFSTGLTGASNSMVNNALIIKKIYFPRLVIPVSALLVALFDFMIAFFLFFLILFYYHQPVSWSAVFYWPFAIIIGILGTLGPGTLMAAMNVKYRDVRYVIPFLIQILFFLSPVIYPMSMLKYPLLKYIVAFNPCYASIELFRMPLNGNVMDSSIYVSLASMSVFLIIGVVYFRKTESYFADFA